MFRTSSCAWQGLAGEYSAGHPGGAGHHTVRQTFLFYRAEAPWVRAPPRGLFSLYALSRELTSGSTVDDISAFFALHSGN